MKNLKLKCSTFKRVLGAKESLVHSNIFIFFFLDPNITV